MTYTVKQLAELSGVSVRTLHFYDEIGLLKPARYGENGYRYYEEEQLLLLQQVLFYRELGFPLSEIQQILGSTKFDKIEALRSHRTVLEKNALQTKKLITTIDQTIAHLKGEKKMSEKKMYEGFDPKKQKEYEKEIMARYGKKGAELVAESKKNTQDWKKPDYDAVKRDHEEINQELATAIEKKLSPSSTEVQRLVAKHFALIQKFYKPTKELYVGLGQMYQDHPDFRKLYDSYHPRLSAFLAEGMKVFAERELS